MDKKDCPAGKKWDRLVNMCIPSEKERSKGADDPSPGPRGGPCKGLCTSGGARVGVDEGPNLENVTPLFLIPNGRPKTETRPEPGKPTEPPPAVVVQLKATVSTDPAHSAMLLSPALWIIVALAIVGSILAVVLWLFIFRRQTRHNNTSEDAERQQEPLQKTEPPAEILPPPSERNGQTAWTPSPCPHLHLGAQTSSNWEEGFGACRAYAEHAGTEEGRGLQTCNTMREHRIPLPATELGGTALVTTKTV